MERVSLSQAPARQFGKYTFIEPLAKGGMAETYRARFTGAAGVTKDVVIKKILPGFADDKSFVQMFINEAKIAATFSHGNIAQVFDFGEIDGEYFLAMELVDGQSLQQVLKRAKQLEIKEVPAPLALLVTMRICEGLHYAHTRVGDDGRPLRIVHRDVTPENVIISYEGQVKLVDFGIAKARTAGRSETEPGMVKGKFLYFSPEQSAGQEVDHRSDVYSAGVVLYSMLCGRLPFEGQAVQVMHRIVTEPVPPPRNHNKNIPPPLERILLKALAKDRNERFQTAQAFGEALSSYLYREEPSFSQTRLASFMTYLFEPMLKAEGRKTVVSEEFLQQLTVWKERSNEEPASAAPARRKTTDLRPRSEQSAAMLQSEPSLGDSESEQEVTQRMEPTESTESSTQANELTLSGPTQSVQPMQQEATRVHTMSLPRASRTAGRRKWAWGLGALLALGVLGAVGVARFSRASDASAAGVVVSVESQPPRAWVELDGKRVPGLTPLTIPGVSAGERHRLRVLAEGAWKPFEAEFVPQAPGPHAITVRLEPLPTNPRPASGKAPAQKGPPPRAPEAAGDDSNLVRFPVGSFQVLAAKHRFAVNESQARYLELDPKERYHLWTEGSLRLNQELGASTRQVLYVLKGAGGAPDLAGVAGPRPVVVERAQALYALVLDPFWDNNQGSVALHLQTMGSGSKRLRLAVKARDNAVELPPSRKLTVSGLEPGQLYRLTVRAAGAESAPGKVACIPLLRHSARADAVTGGQLLLDPGQTYEVAGADLLECAFLALGGEAPPGALEVDIRAAGRPFAPPL